MQKETYTMMLRDFIMGIPINCPCQCNYKLASRTCVRMTMMNSRDHFRQRSRHWSMMASRRRQRILVVSEQSLQAIYPTLPQQSLLRAPQHQSPLKVYQYRPRVMQPELLVAFSPQRQKKLTHLHFYVPGRLMLLFFCFMLNVFS